MLNKLKRQKKTKETSLSDIEEEGSTYEEEKSNISSDSSLTNVASKQHSSTSKQRSPTASNKAATVTTDGTKKKRGRQKKSPPKKDIPKRNRHHSRQSSSPEKNVSAKDQTKETAKDSPNPQPGPETEVVPDNFDGNLNEEHRLRFNLAVFGNSFTDPSSMEPVSAGSTSRNSQVMSRYRLQQEIYILRHWESGDPNAAPPEDDSAPDPRTGIGFRKLHPIGRNTKYQKREVRTIPLENNEEEYALFHEGRHVCSAEQVFDIIHERHGQTGHALNEETTYNFIKDDYQNITMRQVKQFINGCPQCVLRKKKQVPHKGASKPIRSFGFRDRFQADLITMTQEGKEGDKDVYGIEMKFILSCKDHFTQFVMLAAIPSKSTKIIAHHLGIMYGIMGFPTIYQTDNGNEVCV